MSEEKVWATSEDGSFEYISLTKDLVEPVLEVLRKNYILDETLSIIFGMPNNPECISEMNVWFLNTAQDGVSIVAREKATGKIAGASLNKLQDPILSTSFYADHYKACKSEGVKGLLKFTVDLEHNCDILNDCKVTSLLDIMFVATDVEFRKRGIAKKLFKVSIDVAKELKQNENVKVPINDEPLKVGIPPQIVTALCTSVITQKIAKDLNFITRSEVSLNNYTYKGKLFRDIIGNKMDFFTYVYLRI